MEKHQQKTCIGFVYQVVTRGGVLNYEIRMPGGIVYLNKEFVDAAPNPHEKAKELINSVTGY